jgi:hypothetical protein
MIRPFDIRDVSVVQRLQPFARPLACELVAVDGVNVLRDAMRSYLAGGRDNAVVLVERDPDRGIDAFGLMHLLPGSNGDNDHGSSSSSRRSAAMITMAPQPQTDELVEAWMYLAQEFASEAAQRGVHQMFAEVPEQGGESDALHGAGFAPLMQQDLMKLTQFPGANSIPEVSGLREQTKDDEPLIKVLHMRVAPRMTHHAEAAYDVFRSTHRVHKGFVLMRSNELIAHVELRNGRRGVGMQALFRPEAEDDAKPMLKHALARTLDRDHRPVYCTVRQYQSWLLPILDDLGFTLVTPTTLMVRYTAARVHQPVWSQKMEPAVAKKRTSASMHLESRNRPIE